MDKSKIFWAWGITPSDITPEWGLGLLAAGSVTQLGVVVSQEFKLCTGDRATEKCFKVSNIIL